MLNVKHLRQAKSSTQLNLNQSEAWATLIVNLNPIRAWATLIVNAK